MVTPLSYIPPLVACMHLGDLPSLPSHVVEWIHSFATSSEILIFFLVREAAWIHSFATSSEILIFFLVRFTNLNLDFLTYSLLRSLYLYHSWSTMFMNMAHQFSPFSNSFLT